MLCDLVERKISGLLCNKRIRKSAFILYPLFVVLFLFYLNTKTPLLGDDYTYQLIFNTPDKIESVKDIFQSQTNHYNVWGGRVVVHTIAQLLLLLPLWLMDLLNTIVFTFLLYLIYSHINYKRQASLSLLMGVFFFLWFFEPFAETTLWITGSANYMWGTVIILTFLFPYHFYRNKKSGFLIGSLKSVGIFILGILAGCTNENTGAAMIIIVALLLLYYRRNNLQIASWMYVGLLAAIIGYVFMIIAPGNAVRSSDVQTGVFSIIYRLFRNTQALLNTIGVFEIIYIILFAIIYKTKKAGYKDVLCRSLIFQIGTLVAIYVMTLSPSFPERAWFGVIVFIIISLGILVVNINIKEFLYIKYLLISLAILMFAFNLFDVIKDINYVDRTLKERTAYIYEQKALGVQPIYIDRYYNRTKYAMFDPTYCEPMMPIYYGVEVKYRK